MFSQEGEEEATQHSDHNWRQIVPGAFTPVLAKHTKHLNLVDILSVGVDRMQRTLQLMKKQFEAWKGTRLPAEAAKLVIYRAFVGGDLDIPKHLARVVHNHYSILSMRSSRRGACGACRIRSPRRSKNWTVLRNSRQRPGWEHFSKAFMQLKARREAGSGREGSANHKHISLPFFLVGSFVRPRSSKGYEGGRLACR